MDFQFAISRRGFLATGLMALSTKIGLDSLPVPNKEPNPVPEDQNAIKLYFGELPVLIPNPIRDPANPEFSYNVLLRDYMWDGRIYYSPTNWATVQCRNLTAPEAVWGEIVKRYGNVANAANNPPLAVHVLPGFCLEFKNVILTHLTRHTANLCHVDQLCLNCDSQPTVIETPNMRLKINEIN